MILSDVDLEAAMTRSDNALVVSPLAIGAVQPASIDLRLSDEFDVQSDEMTTHSYVETNRWRAAAFPSDKASDMSSGTYGDPRGLAAARTSVGGIPYRRVVVQAGHAFVLQPGAFVLGRTVERVGIPSDMVARVEGKSSLGRLGILVHVTAGYVDPGFDGTLTLELANVGRVPVMLTPSMFVAQLSVMRLTSPASRPYGVGRDSKYQHQHQTTGAR